MDPAALFQPPNYYKRTHPPTFGHGMLKFFNLDSRYINLNNGSYGTLPSPVADACATLGKLFESNPDLFCRILYPQLLVEVREAVAKFLLVDDVNEIVMVPNASHGLNTILRNFIWEENDVIVTCNTTYNSVSRTAQYLSDLPPHPKVSEFTLLFPTTRKDILLAWRAHLRALNQQRVKGIKNFKIVAVVDAIISNPGIWLPWEEMVRVCKEENVWSVVDAAHAIGQQQDLNLQEADPDFWVSNAHKWLFAKRGCAILYVPKRNQHIIRASFPTSYAYVSAKDRTSSNFVEQFAWNGTLDFVPFLSVPAALSFRQWIGGEAEINAYCHKLAVAGGKRLAHIMNTSVMDDSETSELTLNMVNVALPLSPDITFEEIDMRFKRELLLTHHIYAAHFYHNGRWWTRASAQVWNELSDFEKLGSVYLIVCAGIEKDARRARGTVKL